MVARAGGWGNALERPEPTGEQPWGFQGERWITFFYYTCPRARLGDCYVGDTLRTDFYDGSMLIVSACRRGRIVKLLERIFPQFCFYGKRKLLEIHVRKR